MCVSQTVLRMANTSPFKVVIHQSKAYGVQFSVSVVGYSSVKFLYKVISSVLLRDCHGLLYPAGYSRVRVRVGFIQPWPYPYPQPGVGGSAHIFKLHAKSTQTMPDASFGPYVGMFSSFFSCLFSKLTHSL